jgi:hypothetical protein
VDQKTGYHLAARLVGCEHPFDACASGVALPFPSGDFADEPVWVVNAAVQARTAQDADLDLDHVEPAAVLGGVVGLQAAQDAPGFGGREGLIGVPAEWVDRLSCTTRMHPASG